MEVFHDLDRAPGLRRCVVALGNFDGVHLGHRAILNAALDYARHDGARSIALTFDPNPAKVLVPARAPRMLMTLADKLDCLAAAGLDAAVVVPFTHKLSLLSPQEFAREYLVERLQVAAVVVGHNVTFGHNRAGNARVMAELGERLGFEVIVIGPITVSGIEVSSTAIRRMIADADLRQAARLLDRNHFLRGPVVKGRQRGHQLGFPTANLESLTECLPPDGVYATRLVLPYGAFPSITNIGMRPTFAEPARTIETHVFDFDRDLYGITVKLELIERVRPERKFESGEALARQIATDVRRAREILAV
jgi:riboflavin kinase/FMN adenylyltransferase